MSGAFAAVSIDQTLDDAFGVFHQDSGRDAELDLEGLLARVSGPPTRRVFFSQKLDFNDLDSR